ncbi:unnamed protein product [Macrosiphum euphorbiae]|uniref:THAP-type domain-containing protein n=1 Tax=Macrosiphum euphorbiae TaxID=13131 RepID=A0AAV0XDN1_9HEMI|nr:unnamed protein product [Macrosiphum euphorbiae]
MPSCFVCGRSSNSKNKDLGISFHQIPKNENHRAQWLDCIKKCGVDHLKTKPKSIICSEHFTMGCFKNYNRTKLLNETAVPSIVVNRVKSAKIEIPEVSCKLGSSNSNPCSVKSIIVDHDGIQMEGVQPIDTLSVQQPSCSSNAIFTDCSQLTCEPSKSFLKKPLTQKVNSRLLNAEVVKEINNDTPRKNYLKRTISSLMQENNSQKKKIKILNQQIRRQKKTNFLIKKYLDI